MFTCLTIWPAEETLVCKLSPLSPPLVLPLLFADVVVIVVIVVVVVTIMQIGIYLPVINANASIPPLYNLLLTGSFWFNSMQRTSLYVNTCNSVKNYVLQVIIMAEKYHLNMYRSEIFPMINIYDSHTFTWKQMPVAKANHIPYLRKQGLVYASINSEYS